MKLDEVKRKYHIAGGGGAPAAVDGYGSPLAVSTTALAMGIAFLPESGTLFADGRRTEIEELNGFVVSEGKRLGAYAKAKPKAA